MEIIIALVQALLLVLLAPLVSGSARWLRAKMHTRKGPSILQDYYDIAKLFRRQDVHPKDSSFVHKLMPPLFMGVLLVLAMGKMALSMKQIIVASWFIAIFVPWGAATELTIPALACGLAAWLVKMLVFFFICGMFENIVSRVRYKLVGRQTWAVVALALFGFVFCVLGL